MPTIDGVASQSLPWLGQGSAAKGIFDRLNGLLVSKALPDYLAENLAGYLYGASTQAGVATVAALGTVATGFCLSNAPGSNRILVPLRARIVPTTAPAGAATIGWALSYHPTTLVTHTTPLIVRPGVVNDVATVPSPQNAGQADSSFTLPVTQVAIDFQPGSVVGASSLSPTLPEMEFKGEIVLMPGASLSTFSLTTIATACFSMKWLSLPLPV